MTLLETWKEASETTVRVLSGVLDVIRSDGTMSVEEREHVDEEMCSLLDRWTGWCLAEHSWRPPTEVTPAMWELAQGEIHDKRVLLDAIAGGFGNVESGLWTMNQYMEWFRDARAEHDKGLIERFKNVARRYPGTKVPR